jgi:uncharacterized protein
MPIATAIAGRAPFNYTLVKLAMRCNLKCVYCYWFRDDTVYDYPAVLTVDAELAYLSALERHVRRYQLKSFFVLFHGGEPMLVGPRRFDEFCEKLRALEARAGFSLRLSITTNGTLVSDAWIEMFRKHRVSVTLSIDGPQAVHDASRVDLRGRGTHDKTVAALNLMRASGLDPAVLSVCNPSLNPEAVCEYFVDELGLAAFDFLVPDANHEDTPPSIAEFYIRLFDLWYDRYSIRGIRVRFLESIVTGLLGGESHSESIGYGPTSTVTMLTDGSLEPLDVLRTAGNGFTRTKYNIRRDELQSVDQDPLWREVLAASLKLCDVCEVCPYKFACGGGHVASRFSRSRRYDNPSIYCTDFKRIFRHVWTRIQPDLFVETATGQVSLSAALAGAAR